MRVEEINTNERLGITKDGFSPPLIEGIFGLASNTSKDCIVSINLFTPSLVSFFTDYSILEVTENWVILKLTYGFNVSAAVKFTHSDFDKFEKGVLKIKTSLLNKGINI